MSLKQDERGLIGLVGIAIIGIIALFGFSAVAAINWSFLIAALIFTSIPIAFLAVAFFKADKRLILYAIVGSMAVAMLVWMNIYNMIALILIGGAMYYFKTLVPKRITILVMLIGFGGLCLVLGYTYMLMPLGVYP